MSVSSWQLWAENTPVICNVLHSHDQLPRDRRRVISKRRRKALPLLAGRISSVARSPPSGTSAPLTSFPGEPHRTHIRPTTPSLGHSHTRRRAAPQRNGRTLLLAATPQGRNASGRNASGRGVRQPAARQARSAEQRRGLLLRGRPGDGDAGTSLRGRADVAGGLIRAGVLVRSGKRHLPAPLVNAMAKMAEASSGQRGLLCRAVSRRRTGTTAAHVPVKRPIDAAHGRSIHREGGERE